LVGWLSGFRAQTGSVANWRNAAFVRRLVDAAASGGGECGPCPDCASDTLEFALRLRENHQKISVRELTPYYYSPHCTSHKQVMTYSYKTGYNTDNKTIDVCRTINELTRIQK